MDPPHFFLHQEAAEPPLASVGRERARTFSVGTWERSTAGPVLPSEEG